MIRERSYDFCQTRLLTTHYAFISPLNCSTLMANAPFSLLKCSVRNLSHVARNFSYVARKKSQVARRNKHQKDLNFKLLIGNNVEKFLSLKCSLFPIPPSRFLKRCSFLTTKGKIVRFQQQNAALFVWYVIVSYSRTFRKLEKLYLGF